MVNSDPEGTYDPRSSSVTPSRRSFLSKTAAAGGAVLVGSKILPESSGASIKDQPSTGAKINFENEWNEPITTEYATPVARYQYKKGPNSVTSTAPINADHEVYISKVQTDGLSQHSAPLTSSSA